MNALLLQPITRQGAAFFLLMSAVVFGVLMFGAVHPWVYSLVFLMIFAAALLSLPDMIFRDEDGQWMFRTVRTPFTPLFAVMAIFVALQMAPMPQAWLKAISPESLVAARHALPPSQMEIAAPWSASAPYLYPVRQSLVRWCVYGLFYFTLVSLIRTRKRLETAIWVLILLGSFESLYGMIEHFSGHRHIFWYPKEFYTNAVTGTYINHNHLAGFLEMVMPLAVGFASVVFSGRKVRKETHRTGSGIRSLLRGVLLKEGQRFSYTLVLIFLALLMVLGIIFSASRGGILSTAAALFVLGVLFCLKKGHRRKGAAILAFFILVCIYAVPMGAEDPLKRFKHFESDFAMRSQYTRETLNLFMDYPWSGVGAGNFQYVFPKYQGAASAKAFVRFAHNDWVQLLAETGILGFSMASAGLLWGLCFMWRSVLRRRNAFSVGIGSAVLAACAALAVHSYVDFNLHLPANALVLVTLLAVGHGALNISSRRRGRSVAYRYRTRRLKGPGGLLPAVLAVSFIMVGAGVIRHAVAEMYVGTVKNHTLNRDPYPPMARIERAIHWDPANAEYDYKAAWEGIRLRSEGQGGGTGLNVGLQRRIIENLEAAVRKNPMSPSYHLWLGWMYKDLSAEPDFMTKWLPAADESMDYAAFHAGDFHSYPHLVMGRYWLWRTAISGRSDGMETKAENRARWHLSRFLIAEGNPVKRKQGTKIIEHELDVYGLEKLFSDMNFH